MITIDQLMALLTEAKKKVGGDKRVYVWDGPKVFEFTHFPGFKNNVEGKINGRNEIGFEIELNERESGY